MEEENKQNAPEPREQNENKPAEEATPRQSSEQALPAAESVPPVEEAKAEEPASPTEEVKEEEKAEDPTVVDKRWYVIQTLTGQEDKVKQAVDQTIESKKLKDKLFQCLVPTEEIVEIKGGKRVEKVKKMFPGYVFLEMVLDDESWFNIRNTPWVARFIGTKVRPTPVSDREMQRVLKQLGKEEKLLEITFERGEGVRVISGPFRGYTGTVDEVNVGKGKMKVLINIFGRDTPVEVNFEHAQKII
ncbi:MAG: transcription termination/antitermination protein NusG [Candidatus Margulisiibacteriota bacterium]|nr:transcription termination/antitermination protein NusG [Candidatus Margulisiibacteriota bacterium]